MDSAARDARACAMVPCSGPTTRNSSTKFRAIGERYIVLVVVGFRLKHK